MPKRNSSSSSSSSTSSEELLALDPISEWRAWQALSIYFTVLLNRQLRRRWLLEHACMKDKPIYQRFRPITFFEPVPTLHKPRIPSPSDPNPTKHNPYNAEALAALKTSVRLLRGRVEKGKELASEIERRMLDPGVKFPTHFCHTCVVSGHEVDVLLTRCGHRVCRVCFEFGTNKGVYECSICFLPATILERSGREGRIESVGRFLSGKEKEVVRVLRSPIVQSK